MVVEPSESWGPIVFAWLCIIGIIVLLLWARKYLRFESWAKAAEMYPVPPGAAGKSIFSPQFVRDSKRRWMLRAIVTVRVNDEGVILRLRHWPFYCGPSRRLFVPWDCLCDFRRKTYPVWYPTLLPVPCRMVEGRIRDTNIVIILSCGTFARHFRERVAQRTVSAAECRNGE